ncbi:hypothetical protein SopranoGao_1 [Klebsiella phage SopranoGao]|uniref:Uncharacterized protein n=1 Tax=Klebsiella phage SopranoGao TaxID=2026944 RepID=A0A248SKQ3_9CAUD|nr:hypothetical protein KMC54_gp01 [Klebsiella phage SopranoGao]ASV45024.1 hypothetical protein SopranoGao_1 [Klebsiella phage SopranoGao]
MRRLMRAGELRKNKVPVYKPEISTGHHNKPRRYLSGLKNRWEPVESRHTTGKGVEA